MTPPVPVGGWSLVYNQSLRTGGIPTVTKSVASGYAPAISGAVTSGIQILSSGQGVISVQLFTAEMSGQQYDAYAYSVQRTDSGFQSIVAEGFRLYVP